MDPVVTIPVALAIAVLGMTWRVSARTAKAESRLERTTHSAKSAHDRIDAIVEPVAELQRRASRDDERWLNVQASLDRIESRLK